MITDFPCWVDVDIARFQKYKKIRKIKIYKKKKEKRRKGKVEGLVWKPSKTFPINTMLHWIFKRGIILETSEKYKKENLTLNLFFFFFEGAAPPIPIEKKTRESRGSRKPPFPCLQRLAAPPLWFSSSPRQPGTRDNSLSFKTKPGAAPSLSSHLQQAAPHLPYKTNPSPWSHQTWRAQQRRRKPHSLLFFTSPQLPAQAAPQDSLISTDQRAGRAVPHRLRPTVSFYRPTTVLLPPAPSTDPPEAEEKKMKPITVDPQWSRSEEGEERSRSENSETKI